MVFVSQSLSRGPHARMASTALKLLRHGHRVLRGVITSATVSGPMLPMLVLQARVE
jgi:hypothetical protein